VTGSTTTLGGGASRQPRPSALAPACPKGLTSPAEILAIGTKPVTPVIEPLIGIASSLRSSQ
jgi:hypothetical protein